MPLYRKSKLPCGTVITIWKIEEAEFELRPMLSLNFEELSELNAIRYPQSRKRWMASRLALKSAFDDWRVIGIQKDCHGKPFFEAEEGSFSLSHSGAFAVCAYHPKEKMGIDIEIVRSKVLSIRHKFMKEQELASLPADNLVKSLYVCWCAKEAAYKWRGKKGFSMKSGITVEPFSYSATGSLTLLVQEGEQECRLTVAYQEIEDYMMAYIVV